MPARTLPYWVGLTSSAWKSVGKLIPASLAEMASRTEPAEAPDTVAVTSAYCDIASCGMSDGCGCTLTAATWPSLTCPPLAVSMIRFSIDDRLLRVAGQAPDDHVEDLLVFEVVADGQPG